MINSELLLSDQWLKDPIYKVLEDLDPFEYEDGFDEEDEESL